jgi:hypothetical protein
MLVVQKQRYFLFVLSCDICAYHIGLRLPVRQMARIFPHDHKMTRTCSYARPEECTRVWAILSVADIQLTRTRVGVMNWISACRFI